MENAATLRPNASTNRNRRDHYLPQSYLRGFIDPARINHRQPLWHFDIPNGRWSERSPREVGWRRGFYDYATSENGPEAADSAFAELERTFPLIRGELTSNKFKNWKDHRDFLMRYIQMMRARSLLFFDEKNAEGENLRVWTIEEISPDRKSVKVRSMTPEPVPDAMIRNWTITDMRAEIHKGAAWLNDFNWALRYCDSPASPFITSEIPFISQGHQVHLADALLDPETLLFFPLCWQACLIGSRQFFQIETDGIGEEDMRRVRRIYRESAKLFLLSPKQLDFS
ncbi:MAG TPA: DUF4238 domain-containing protein [Terriglobia bacterium]|nr:DUF4238 domain-containing protein [Terriglobia bacterium]